MADTKLADLTALTETSNDDLLYVVDDPAGTPADRKLALSDVFKRGTVTTSSPVIDAAQTWNDGAVTFTGLKFNAAGTSDANSASGSLLMDLQVGGDSAFNVSKAGSLKLGVNTSGTNVAASNVVIAGSQGTGTGAGGSIIFRVAPAGGTSNGVQNALATALTINSLGQIQSNLYGYEVNNNTSVLFSVQGTTLIGRSASTISFGQAAYWQMFEFYTTATLRWSINNSGHFLAGTDNTYDIGASGANRPRNVYVAGSYTGSGYLSAASGYYYWAGRSTLSSPADGQVLLANLAVTDFGRLQFGGTSSAFPALKRVSANLQVIAADGTSSAGLIVGNQALATAATDGFLYVPTCAGTPTGTPTTQTGTVPIVVDTSANKLYFYSGAAWRDASV